jgi:glycosyltransferase involved in cell wall biosynthesis
LPRPVHPSCRLCVTVPAKDEAAFIGETLAALYHQCDNDGFAIDHSSYEVILLANNCCDDTVAVANSFAAAHPDFCLHVIGVQLPQAIAGVGAARRMMMDAAARRLPDDGIICTTDADTIVEPNWVYATLRAFDGGARAVGGRIVVPPGLRKDYRKIYLQDVTYRLLQAQLESIIDPDHDNPWPRHFQNFGPSMAVRVDAYQACGGIPPTKCIEDVALAWALERIDVSFVHDLRIRVRTSDRDSHRIDGVAFSHQLTEWSRMLKEGRKPVVFGLDHLIKLFKWKVALRRAYYDRRIGRLPALSSLTDYLKMTPAELENRITNAPTFGALYQDIRQLLEGTHEFSNATFDEAIRGLRRFMRSAHSRPSISSSRHRAGSVPDDPRVRDEIPAAFA